jgi:hypothetical protein
MPTIPLYEMPTRADGWHHVTAPGGYEAWDLDASSPDRGTRIAIGFYDGFVLSQSYRRAYARYVRRPTLVPPPVPREYPAIFVEWRERDVRPGFFGAQYPADTFRYSAEPQSVTIGASSIDWLEGGALRVRLSRLAPWNGRDKRRTLDAELTFQPETAPSPMRTPVCRVENDRKRWPPTHHYAVTKCVVSVTGTLTETLDGATHRSIEFSGAGSYQHGFGTGPSQAI